MKAFNAKQKKLIADTLAKLEQLKDMLSEASDKANEYHEDQSEHWHSTEAGSYYGDWITEIDTAQQDVETTFDSLQGLSDKPADE